MNFIENKEHIDSNGVLTIDIKFTSPSAAASFVAGNPRNGLKEWKDENGVSLGELRR